MFPSPLKRSPIKRSADESDDWPLKNLEDMRSRHPMFRLPNWMSDDDDMSNLSSRMSQTPHFGTSNLRGPWRERRDSGGHVSSSDNRDSVDGHRLPSEPIQIPIRIEAEAPPGCISPSTQTQCCRVQEDKPLLEHDKQVPLPVQEEHAQTIQTDPHLCVGHLRKQPQYASRTTSAVNALSQEDVPRDTRCASAPPDMPDPRNSHKYVSSMKVIPQNITDKSHFGNSPVFNNVPKPYSKVSQQTPSIREEKVIPTENITNTHQSAPHFEERQEPHSFPQYQQFPHQHWGSGIPKASVIRNIPIMIEGRDEECSSPSRSPQQSYHPEDTRWDNSYGNQTSKFPHTYEFSRPDQSYDFLTKMAPQETRQNHHPTHFQYQHIPQTTEESFQEQCEQEPLQCPEQVEQSRDLTLEDEGPVETKPVDSKINIIDDVRTSITGYLEQVKNFKGIKMDKEYRYLDEMLTRALLQLDNIDPDGRDDVRQARKTLVKDINDTIATLEKLARDAKSQEKLIPTIPKDSTANESKLKSPYEVSSVQSEIVMEPECPKSEVFLQSQDNQQPLVQPIDQNSEIKEATVENENQIIQKESSLGNC